MLCRKGRDRFISWEWLYGHNPTFENDMSFRFDWGGIDLCFSVEKGIIKEAVILLRLPESGADAGAAGTSDRSHLSEGRYLQSSRIP